MMREQEREIDLVVRSIDLVVLFTRRSTPGVVEIWDVRCGRLVALCVRFANCEKGRADPDGGPSSFASNLKFGHHHSALRRRARDFIFGAATVFF